MLKKCKKNTHPNSLFNSNNIFFFFLCLPGIRPVDFFGNFYMSNTTDVELAAVDSEQSIAVEIRHDDKLSEAEGAFVQVIWQCAIPDFSFDLSSDCEKIKHCKK